MKISNLLLIWLVIITSSVYSQDSEIWEIQEKRKIEVGGYISNMQSVMFTDLDGEWLNDNLFHNRINLFWYPVEAVTASIQFRNRFMYGGSILADPGFTDRIDEEANFFDLSFNLATGNSYLLNSSIDRLYFQYSRGNFAITIGRQRINWGQCLIWNPNDIFNVQNFFDFDYIENPGSDALRLQYYPGYASTLELAAKLGPDKKLTAAGYFRFNRWNYDIQFLGGLHDGSDIFAGLGWAGDIKGAGFRGEASYFRSYEEFSDTSGQLVASISLDYSFSNSLYLQFESLYSGISSKAELNFLKYLQGNLDVKQLSFSKWNYLMHISYPLNPLLNISLSGIYFPDLEGFYLGPDFRISLSDNSDLSFIAQIFNGSLPDPLTYQLSDGSLFLGFIRYKYNF